MLSKGLRNVVLFAVAVLVVAPAFAQNSLDVNATAAMGGAGSNFGLEAIAQAGQTNNVYVEDQTPDAETVYRAQFWFDPNDLGMDDRAEHSIFASLNDAFTSTQVVVFTRFKAGSGYRIRCRVTRNSGVKRGSGFLDLDNGPNLIQVEWEQASGPGLNDGGCNLSIIGGAGSGQTTNIDIKNHLLSIDRVRMGMTGQNDANTAGSSYYDEFESFRTLAP